MSVQAPALAQVLAWEPEQALGSAREPGLEWEQALGPE
jgi:hypothetical protein